MHILAEVITVMDQMLWGGHVAAVATAMAAGVPGVLGGGSVYDGFLCHLRDFYYRRIFHGVWKSGGTESGKADGKNSEDICTAAPIIAD